VREQKSQVKMMIAFHCMFLRMLQICVVKTDCQEQILLDMIKRLVPKVRGIMPEFQHSGFLCSLDNSTLAHSPRAVSEFLAKQGISTLYHPFYFPDLGPFQFS
jgi:hypothetical protein